MSSNKNYLPSLNPFSKYVVTIDRDNNMGLVRYILALGVIISHFNVLCGASIPWIITENDRVGGFFALSGFLLVSPVLKGVSFKKFAIRRCWRILPSYLFVVIVAAVALSAVSSLPSAEYFTSGEFYEYLLANLSFLNFLHPDLPGVFECLNLRAVNGALWTMKVEWQLTLTLPLIIWFIKKYNISLRKTIIFIIVISVIYRFIFHYLYGSTEKPIYEILGRQFFGQTLFFYSGIMIYTFYEYIHSHWKKCFLVSLIIYIAFRLTAYNPYYFEFFHPFVISVLVLSASLIPGNIMKYIDGNRNISYEIYLWHFPVVQCIAQWGIMNSWGVAATFAFALSIIFILGIITYLLVGHLYLNHKN